MEIPKQIENFNFVLIGGDGKQPIEKRWQKKIHRIDCKIFQKHISEGKNYGVQPNNSSVVINGEPNFLLIIDFDTKEFQDKVIDKFPETFTTTSGSSKNCVHLWLASDNNKAFKIKDEQFKTLADVIGSGNQIIAPGSKHSSGSIYSVVKDIPIAFMSYAEIEAILKPYDKTPKKEIKPKKDYAPKGISDNITQDIYNSVSINDVLLELGIPTDKNPTECPLHSSAGGKCLLINDDGTFKCFHCDKSFNKFSLIREAKNLTDRQTFDWFAEKAGRSEDLKKSRREYQEKNKKDNNLEVAAQIFTLKGQTEMFNELQPIFYDRNGLWWLWNNKSKYWEISDEVDILNMIHGATGKDVITSSKRTEILNSLKQRGRLNVPRPIEKTWIQFKDKIYDIKTGECFEAKPEYFVTNPIPWEVSYNPTTPTIDRIFREWVGEDYIKTLHEIIAYCLLPDYPINRLFCFIGGGMNGKSCFLNLLKKFVGDKNICSTELDTLISSRFEVTRLHKKLVCMMGETNFNEINKTSIIKKLTGKDTIGFEYKNKNPFEDFNYAKILIATNNLPTTTDKTIGFYRRWLIIDFPNKFSERKDILEEIPEEEFNNLASNCIVILNELLQKREFSNEGTIESRMKRYEDHSDPLEKFLKEFTDEDVDGFIWKFEFEKKLNEWCTENRFRQLSEVVIGKKMKEKNINQELRQATWLIDGIHKRFRAWVGIKWRNEQGEQE